MSPEVIAAVIAASVSFLTLIGTVIVQVLGFQRTRDDTRQKINATHQDTANTLTEQRNQLDSTLAEQREQLDKNLRAQRESLDKQLAAQREDRVTDRFIKAVDQLAGNQVQRIGGIYTLERIMRESDMDHSAIVDVLGAFIRLQASGQTPPTIDKDTPADERAPVEVQVALSVLGRRPREGRLEGGPIRLSRVNLGHTLLRDAHLECVRLRHAHLEGIHWEGTHLEGARLRGAHLENADLEGVHLEWASLSGAHLTGAVLRGAHLAGVQGDPDLTLAQRQALHCRPQDATCSEGRSDNPCAQFPW
jgi:hypothetical protein